MTEFPEKLWLTEAVRDEITVHRSPGGDEEDFFFLAGYAWKAPLIVIATTTESALAEDGRVRAELIIRAVAGYVPTGAEARRDGELWLEYERRTEDEVRALYQVVYGKPYGEWGVHEPMSDGRRDGPGGR